MGDSDPTGKLSQTGAVGKLAQTFDRITIKRIGPALPYVAQPRAVRSAVKPAARPVQDTPAVRNTESGPGPAGPPSHIGRYLVLRALGEGGMGVVYAGYDEELDRKVAIKLLHPEQQGDSELRARILREAQSLARVSAPNVVHVYEVGEFAGQLFIVMEFVNGTTLTNWQAEEGRSWRDILHMYCAAGQGLLDAHEAGLVHRDFKPDNVLLAKDGRPRVADFGLARLQNPEGGPGANDLSTQFQVINQPGDSNPVLTPLTQVGMVLGTPLYMAPEQHLGEVVDSRSDQFSFCVALYEALYRQLPFAGTTLQELAASTLEGKIRPRPAGSKVPTPVHEALLRGLDKTPDQRFPSMRELLAALAFDPTSDTATAPQARRWVAVSVPAFAVVYAVGLQVLRLLGVSELTSSVASLATLFLFCTLVPLRFRRVLATNSFHRGVMIIGVTCIGHLFCLRVVGILLGLALPQIVTLDLLAITAMAPVLASMCLPSMWPLFPIAAISALVAAARPEYAQPLASVVLPGAIIACIVAWNKAVKTRVQIRKVKPAPPAPDRA